ncbi:hypothetical protein GLYMA_12G032850v4 [Glycine max]|nr:hypothetical protein GLYMA_12G032850v4 [Glycine max]KAH1141384.1 hypothetical protein GYH30_032568 [Glycine max]
MQLLVTLSLGLTVILRLSLNHFIKPCAAYFLKMTNVRLLQVKLPMRTILGYIKMFTSTGSLTSMEEYFTCNL